MAKKVAIFGGGVAGLTAAHELALAGSQALDITVYERNPDWGGKARSFRKAGSAVAPGTVELPGEHGFRFFPGYYRHLIDTMKKIPFPAGGAKANVAGNLVPAPETKMLQLNGPPLSMPNQMPAEPSSWVSSFQLGGSKITPAEAKQFVAALTALGSACDERREAEYDGISWFDFVGGPKGGSDYRRFLADGLNQRTVAASGRNVSARTVGITLLRIMNDWMTSGNIDRLLDGPTSDQWLTPWRVELQSLGVSFVPETALVSFATTATGGLHDVTGAVVTDAKGATSTVVADAYVMALPVDDARAVATASQLLALPELRGFNPPATKGDPEMLSGDWMNGIQLYLKGQLNVPHGHAIYIDAPFSLTSVAQRQFWDGVDFGTFGDGTIQGILSVDISDWDAPSANGKRAKDMTRAEVAEEVIRQVEAHMVAGFGISLPAVHSWFLDPAIVEDPNPKAVPRLSNSAALFINRVGSWSLRPEVTMPSVPALFLASDYVRTRTDLATMEGANEAGRLAARGVLDRLKMKKGSVKLFAFDEPAALAGLRAADKANFAAGLPLDIGKVLGGMVTAVPLPI